MDELTRLALLAGEGDRLALGAFIRMTHADVWKTCRHLGPRGQADDLTQDVFVRMMRTLPSFTGESSARTWLLSIAKHTAIDALRTQQRRARIQAIAMLAMRTHEEPDHRADIAGMIEVLDGEQRHAFVLTQVIGLSYEEAAEVCSCPVGTIRSRVARARARLITTVRESMAT